MYEGKAEILKRECGHHKRILFAAGGTGGHIFPALAVEKAIMGLDGSVETRFVCGSRPVEVEIYRRSGTAPVILDVQPLRSGFLSRSMGILHLFKGFAEAVVFLRKWKPDRILAQGGYITAPVLLAAGLLGIPYDLQEQNSVPGRTNRWFARRAGTVYCSFEQAIARFGNGSRKIACLYTGMPLRSEAIGTGKKRVEVCRSFGLDPSLPVLLILGGSQGARHLYEQILNSLYQIDSEKGEYKDFQCLWSTGQQNLEWIRENLVRRPFSRIRVVLRPFIEDMGAAYSIAAAAISRAGACSVAELMANRIPTIFIPLPHAVNDHQRENARAVVKDGAGYFLEEGNLGNGRFAETLGEVLYSEKKRAEMIRAAEKMFPLDAAKIIALEMMKKI